MTAQPLNTTLDRRQIKTRRSIQSALLTLMSRKPLEKITVSELALTANINRKTFYNHYSSIQDVRREMDQQYIDRLISFLREKSALEFPAGPTFFVEHLVADITAHPAQYRLFFDSGEYLYLAEQFKALVFSTLEEAAGPLSRHPEYLPYALEYLSNGLVALLRSWITAENPLPESEFTKLAVELIISSAAVLDFPHGEICHAEY